MQWIILFFIFCSGWAQASLTDDFVKISKSYAYKSLLDINDYQLALNKSALNKEYFLFTSLHQGAPINFGRSQRSKIVSFEKQGNQLYLFESLTQKEYSRSLSTKKILAAFPITHEDEKTLYFDFKQGMNRLVYASEWYHGSPEDNQEYPLKIDLSYIEQMKIEEDRLFINLISQITPPRAEFPVSMEIKFTFMPYSENPNFKLKLATDKQRVGFFEGQPLIEAGTARMRKPIFRFDETKFPITYHISQSVPEDYVQAVKDGILYWNRVFGREALKVERLKEGQRVLDAGLNVVQWVDFDAAGSAYADMKVNPLTGELKQVSVFMTSVFAVSSKKRARDYLLQLDAEQAIEQQKVHSYQMKGFENQNVCSHTGKLDLAADLDIFEQSDILNDSAVLLRFSQDYVRHVIAHEVGHTLGLRHNFAGNVKANITSKNIKHIMRAYFSNGEVEPSIIPTTSVMEYSYTLEAVLSGAKIRLGQPGLPYDKAAIKWGYSEAKVEELNIPLFCTDNHAGKYPDCNRFDRFQNIFDGAYAGLMEKWNQLPHELALRFLKETRDSFPRQSVSQVKLDPTFDALNMAISPLKSFLNLFHANNIFLDIAREYPFEEGLYAKEILEKSEFRQAKELKSRGGLADAIISQVMPIENQRGYRLPFLAKAEDQFLQMITDHAFVYADEQNPFSSLEIVQMSKIAPIYFDKLNERVFEGVLATLAGLHPLYLFPEYRLEQMGVSLPTAVSAYNAIDPIELEDALFQLAKKVLLTIQTQESIQIEGKDYTLYQFAFPFKQRKLAAKLLDKKLYPLLIDFQEQNRKKMFDQYKQMRWDLSSVPRSYRLYDHQMEEILSLLK